MIRVIVFSSKLQKTFVITFKKVTLLVIRFQVELAYHKTGAVNTFRYRDYGDV